MSNSTTLSLYDSPHKLLETMAEVVSVPRSLKVTDILTGILNEGQENERAWANLTAVDSNLYEQFKSIGLEKYCTFFTRQHSRKSDHAILKKEKISWLK